MKTAFLILLMGVLVLPARAQACTLEIADETHALEHVHVLRIPDPFDDAVRITRLVCTSVPLAEADLADWAPLLKAFHADGQRGVFVDLRDDGTPISVRLSWGEWSSQWSSSTISEVQFEGTLGPDRFAGTITTDPPLKVFRKDVTWRVSARIDRAPTAVW
jgi:hypothetical protein